jgi:Ca2+-transporting ATPase
VTSLVPGRVRIFFNVLKGNHSFAFHLNNHCELTQGIFSLQANPASGKVLVYFNNRQATPEEIVNYLSEAWQTFRENRMNLQHFSLNREATAQYPMSVHAKMPDAPLMVPETMKKAKHPLVDGEYGGGLTDDEVRLQRVKYGWNALAQEPPPSVGALLVRQSKDVLVQVHLGVIVLTCLLGRPSHAVLTAIIVAINLGIGIFQEKHAETAAACLKKTAEPKAKVRRSGVSRVIRAEEVVPGDIIEVEAGDRVPADASLVPGSLLEIEESVLSGETVPIVKAVPVVAQDTTDTQRKIFMGTNVTKGRAFAVVTSIGMDTEMGKISKLMSGAREDPTPLQRRLEELGQYLVYGGLGIAGFLLLIGCLRGRRFLTMLHTAASLAVAVIPEGLNPIVLIAMAMGVRRIAKRNGIVKKLSSLETLGGVSVICSDKTGTLTKNEMTVQEIYAGGRYWERTETGFAAKEEQDRAAEKSVSQNLYATILAGALCNNAVLGDDNQTRNGGLAQTAKKGDPTELALLGAADVMEIDLNRISHEYSRLRELPFEAERRLMSIICSDDSGKMLIVTKGAADAVLERCTCFLSGEKEAPLNLLERNKIFEAHEYLTRKGFRVIATACKVTNYEELIDTDIVERNLVFCGLFGLVDPPRQEARAAIAKCATAGIKVVMITGDHPNTAAAVAHQLRLGKKEPVILVGSDIDGMSDQELREAVSSVDIFARTLPIHKLRIVRAFKDRGKVVAMTGDGVNDAPALKEAHVGIAMGTTGTDVTKGAAGLVLVDDNFATIVSAVEEGRAISANIRNVVRYLIAANIGEVVLLMAAILIGMPCPLLPLQLLLLNLVGDGLPSIALANDPPAKGVMRRPPREAKESVFADQLARKIVSRGMALGVMSLFVYTMKLKSSHDLRAARTMVFSQLAIGQLIHVFDCRWDNQNGRTGLTSNLALLGSVAISLGIVVAAVHLPGLRQIFGLNPLKMTDWLTAAALAALTIPLDSMLQKGHKQLTKVDTQTSEIHQRCMTAATG